MDVLFAVVAMALAVALVFLVGIVVLRWRAKRSASDSLVQTLARAYRNSWRHSHKL
jgi:hypothetical protein